MWFARFLWRGRPAKKVGRVGAFFLLLGIAGLASDPHDRGTSTGLVVAGGLMLGLWVWDSIVWRERMARGLDGVAGYGPASQAYVPPALAQLVRMLGSTYAAGGDLLPRDVQSAAAQLGLNPRPRERGSLRQVKAVLAAHRTPILLVNSRKLPGRRVSRAWYPIVVLAVAGPRGHDVARIVDPAIGRPEDLDAYAIVDAWRADDRFVTLNNLYRALGAGKPAAGSPRMWLEVLAQ